ncbi:MAG TPA: TRAP transporter small permease subunit [Methyloceanibacter sp.]|jgi:TRAP-type mannitol/chloroaromatic compound transport system permease small subunit|nr:TRAP transporter small permease subunit [Methyloceanibacter sp.]
MPKAIRLYVRYVDAVNRAVGRSVMWLVLVMMLVLIYAVVARTVFGVSYIWVVETSQMLLAAYYILGGGYSLQLGTHVRMDLLYSRWSERTRARVDSLTSGLVIFYLVVLLLGGVYSTIYAIEYSQKNYSSWAPVLWPIKVVMCIGILLMLLQMIAVFFTDLAKALGLPIDGEPLEEEKLAGQDLK